jgi:hypothetical protein
MPRSRAKRDRKLEKYGRCKACGWLVPQLRMAEHINRFCFRQAKPEPVVRLVETHARVQTRPVRKQSMKRSTSRLPRVPDKGVVPIRRAGQRLPEDVSIIAAGPHNIKFRDPLARFD